MNPLEDKDILKPLSLIPICLRAGGHLRAKTHGDGGGGGEGMQMLRKDRRGGIEHRIYLSYHLVWDQPTQLTPKSNDRIQLNPDYILRLRFWIL